MSVKYSSKKNSKKKKSLVTGIVHVHATFNNTIISVTDTSGNLLCWSSAGKHGFKGSRKATPYAAQVATQSVIETAKECGLQTVSVIISGPGVGREASLRALQSFDSITTTSIVDVTYHPHNGCRPPKRRRV
ncbi:MAG: 30S ribosomal protein S11 [Proteobacteria bacterium]|nr:30S ribosomal protein S11 [Pseudomonadota bacterium]